MRRVIRAVIEGANMQPCVWILDAHGEGGAIAGGLARAGLSSLEFTTPGAFLAFVHCWQDLPAVAVVDARTALGYERDIRDAMGSHLVILTAWHDEWPAWRSVGVSRFVLRPFSIDSLLESVQASTSVRTIRPGS